MAWRLFPSPVSRINSIFSLQKRLNVRPFLQYKLAASWADLNSSIILKANKCIKRPPRRETHLRLDLLPEVGVDYHDEACQWKKSLFPFLFHRIFIPLSRISHTIPKVYPRYTQGVPKVYPRYTQGVAKVYPRCSQGQKAGITLDRTRVLLG